MAYIVNCNITRAYTRGEIPQHAELEHHTEYSELLFDTFKYSFCRRCALIQIELSEVDQQVVITEFKWEKNINENRPSRNRGYLDSSPLAMRF